MNDWLRAISIHKGHVVLGDFSEEQLVQLGRSGIVLLCDGELRKTPQGMQRIGKSGVVWVSGGRSWWASARKLCGYNPTRLR